MIRIDPLTEDGKFNINFFSSEEYTLYRAKVEEYVLREGFDLEPNTYVIRLLDHFWQVQTTPFGLTPT